jgi:TonB-linked SusC/RagA family outer membrane protein
MLNLYLKTSIMIVKKTMLLATLCSVTLGVGFTPHTFAVPSMSVEGILQAKKVTGVVMDAFGPVTGANVLEQGTTNGVITDLEGRFTLEVQPGAKLEISFIGYKVQVIEVGNQTDFRVTLIEDNELLDEVVVVGYGVQKKKLVTGATVQVKGDDVAKLNTTSALGALQGQTPGVNITSSSGQPGDGFKVNIRGLGTIGDSEPLYVIDGVAGGDINMLNPADIESIDVLKDAASAAIYGSRAANGVILVTTKQGKEGKMQVTYDGYMGWQNVYKMPSLLTAQQSMGLIDEQAFNDGTPATNWQERLGNRVYGMIQDGWQGSNFLEAMREKNALTQNHAVNIAGGTELSKVSAGFSYTSQEGILGKPVTPQYNRYTARLNSSHVLLKGKDRDIIKVGENLSFYYSERSGIASMGYTYNDITNAINAVPFLPIYNKSGELYAQADKNADGWIYNAEAFNPLLQMINDHGNNLSRNYGLSATAYLEIEPVKNLKYRGAFSYRMTNDSYRSMVVPYRASINTGSDSYIVHQDASLGHEITWENTISYILPEFNGHKLDVLLGQSFEKTAIGEELSAQNSVTDGSQLPILDGNFNHAWLDNASNILASTQLEGSPWPEWALASFFGRINYNYHEKYMATFILRADGSSNFARGNRWGYFPSASVGWVLSEEKFMQNSRRWLDFLKIRASWGRNGNQSIDNFQYVSPIAFDQSHVYGFGQTIVNTIGEKSPGAYVTTLANEDVTWETSEQFDLGIDARFFNSRLGLAFDYYIKTTKDWLVQAPILDTAGTNAPYVNGGDVRNQGFEIALNWNDRVGKDFTYGVNVNLSYNKNEVTRIANEEGVIHGDDNALGMFRQLNEFYRAEVGYPIGYFYGYETAGVFQNQAEIEAWRATGDGFAQSNPQPGDLIYVDQNHDGVIDEDDKTMIGDPNPDYRLGFGFNLGYKGLDLSVTTQGAFGQQLFYGYRDNTTDALDHWRGEGTNYRFPRKATSAKLTGNVTDIDIENGSYLKIQNITLGYDFKKLFPNMPLQQARLYISAQNLFTFTKYPGMDPEVGYGGGDYTTNTSNAWVSGIDVGSYPSARTFLIGVNLKY